METIYINGKYLSQRVTGVQRYAREVVKQFEYDEYYKNYNFVVVCPEDADIPEGYTHIKYVKINKKGYFFEQLSLPKYLKKNKAKILLNMCNLAPIKFPGSTVVHDLNIIDNKNFYSFAYRTIVKFINKRNVKKYKPIYTVSNFSKERIKDYYKLKNDSIITTYAGVSLRDKIADFSSKFSFIQDDFYLTVGSFNKTKNLKYIIEAAKNNPTKKFVITGGMGKVYAAENLEAGDNVIFTGYITDEELDFLYSKCQAFIFPSFYEGFGAPPLEAIACGCRRIILSDINVFREIYDDYVSYCNPYDVNTINDLLDKSKVISEEDAKELLKKYSWFNVARILFDGLGGKN